MSSHVIAIANQKGGVGKTTTTVNLGASLAAAEQRTLVIDLDPQGNASSGLGLGGFTGDSAPEVSLYEVLLEGAPLAPAIVRGVQLPYLDLVPTTPDLVGSDAQLMRMPEREFRLRHALRELRDEYDFVLIDCPPALSLFTFNALVAADTVLVPLQPEFFALEGLAEFSSSLRMIQRYVNPDLGLEGVLLTMYDGRLKLTREVAQQAEAIFGTRVFRTVIPRNVTLAEAPGFGKPALMYDLESPGAKAYLALAKEVLDRSAMMWVDRHRYPFEELAGGAAR